MAWKHLVYWINLLIRLCRKSMYMIGQTLESMSHTTLRRRKQQFSPFTCTLHMSATHLWTREYGAPTHTARLGQRAHVIVGITAQESAQESAGERTLVKRAGCARPAGRRISKREEYYCCDRKLPADRKTFFSKRS